MSNVTTSSLLSLGFSDIFLSVEKSWVCGVPGKPSPLPLPAEYLSEAAELFAICIQAHDAAQSQDFQVVYKSTKMRVSIMHSTSGVVFVLRRFGDRLLGLSELGFHGGIVRRVMVPDMTGLVLIAGATGAGKTTTAAAYIKERLERFGGVAVTAEDPPEIPMDGTHGPGVCFQTEVPKSGGFAQACKSIVRWRPNIIFLGEIRDSATAAEALRACINGHLVVSTIHADGVVSAIQRLINFAESDLGGEAAALLSNGLQAVLHQSLQYFNGRNLLRVEPLVLTEERFYGVRQTIREKRFEMLSSDIQQLQNIMAMEGRG